jgi:hypothetical protein
VKHLSCARTKLHVMPQIFRSWYPDAEHAPTNILSPFHHHHHPYCPMLAARNQAIRLAGRVVARRIPTASAALVARRPQNVQSHVRAIQSVAQTDRVSVFFIIYLTLGRRAFCLDGACWSEGANYTRSGLASPRAASVRHESHLCEVLTLC